MLRPQRKTELFSGGLYPAFQGRRDREESDSVGNQKKLLSDFIGRQGDLLLYDFYVDDGFTGTSFDRPAFRRMLGDIEQAP